MNEERTYGVEIEINGTRQLDVKLNAIARAMSRSGVAAKATAMPARTKRAMKEAGWQSTEDYEDIPSETALISTVPTHLYSPGALSRRRAGGPGAGPTQGDPRTTPSVGAGQRTGVHQQSPGRLGQGQRGKAALHYTGQTDTPGKPTHRANRHRRANRRRTGTSRVSMASSEMSA